MTKEDYRILASYLAVLLVGLGYIPTLVYNYYMTELKGKQPVIQQVGVPFYFTNTVVFVIPTNSIPSTKTQ